jgi:DNA-directed RNA polymerase specialized sigma24 family protein
MLMTHTPREYLAPAAECDEQIGIPDMRHIEPDGELDQNSFSQQFLRCRETLHFIACRILSSVDEAETAVRNCHRTASRNPLHFQSEGAFRSWLVRILIDEATLLLRRGHSGSAASSRRRPEAH